MANEVYGVCFGCGGKLTEDHVCFLVLSKDTLRRIGEEGREIREYKPEGPQPEHVGRCAVCGGEVWSEVGRPAFSRLDPIGGPKRRSHVTGYSCRDCRIVYRAPPEC